MKSLVDKLLDDLGLGLEKDEVIILESRENTLNFLEKIEENKYRLDSQYSFDKLLGEIDNIAAVDPIDGPYMGIGYEIVPGKVINKIEVNDDIDIILTLREK